MGGRCTALLVTLFALSGFLPARAVIPGTIHQEPFSGNAWAAFRVRALPGPTGVTVAITDGGARDAGPMGQGFWVFQDGELMNYLLVTVGPPGEEVYAGTQPTGVILEEGDPRWTYDTPFGWGAGIGVEGGVIEVVLVAVLAVEGGFDGRFSVIAEPGSEVLEASFGTETGILADEDLTGDANVHAYAVRSGLGTGAGAVVGNTTEVTFEDRVFGLFYPGDGLASWEGGGKSGDGVMLFTGDPPDVYTFTLTAAVSRLHQFLWYGDVELPA